MNDVRNEPTLHAMPRVDAEVESVEGPGAAPPAEPRYEAAPGRSRHHPVGRLPITFIPSTTSRRRPGWVRNFRASPT